MTRVSWITLTLSVVLTSPVFAAGIDMTWDNCAADGGTSDIVFDCATYGGTAQLFGSWISDVEIQQFHTLELIIDLQADAPDLPPFWDFFPGCNWQVLLDTDSFDPVCASYRRPWGQYPPGGWEIPLAYYPHFGGVANRGRFVGTIYRTIRTAILADRPYFAFILQIWNDFQCEGCTTPVVLVFNQATLLSDTLPPVVITNPGQLSNCATTSGGGGVPCGATPATHKTWGALKTLYR